MHPRRHLHLLVAALLGATACVEPPSVAVDQAALAEEGPAGPSPCAVTSVSRDTADEITPLGPAGANACATLLPTNVGLFVGYDTALRATRSDAEIRAWIEARVVEANQIFVNSGAPIRYEPVFIREVSPNLPRFEGTPATGADRLRDSLRDWSLNSRNSLRKLRDAYGADVSVFVAEPFTANNNDFCGIGSLPVLRNGNEVLTVDLTRPFTDEAFAIVRFGCGLSPGRNDFTFAHELGHTFGMHHGGGTVAGALLASAYGAVIRPNQVDPAVATVMHCQVVPGTPPNAAPDGVCSRIPHFSSPQRSYTLPGCTAKPCTAPTTATLPGGVQADNAGLACTRAPRYAGFRTPDSNQPPTVRITSQAPAGSVLSGGQVTFSATATDPEQGDLTSSIRWINQADQLLGTGPTVTLRVLQPGELIAAQITDAGGKVDEWWVTSPATWPNDGYVDDDSADAPTLDFGTWQVRSFDRPTDVDHVRVASIPPGQRVRIALTGYTPRARPTMRVRHCDGTVGCGSWQPVASPYEVVPDPNNYSSIIVEITNTDRLAGLDTDYLIRADLVTPALVTPAIGPWYNPARSGHGIDLQSTGGADYVAVWYTYRADGTPTWYISDVAPLHARRWSAPLFESTWDGTRNRVRAVGAVSYDWSGTTAATMSWSLDGIGAGSEPFDWLLFAGATGVANGLWYAPSQSGWGASIWHQADTLVLTSYTYDTAGRPTWAQGAATGAPTNVTFADMYQVHGGNSLCPGCTGTTPRTVFNGAGSATFRLTNAAQGQAQFSINQTYLVAPGGWVRSVEFARLTQ